MLSDQSVTSAFFHASHGLETGTPELFILSSRVDPSTEVYYLPPLNLQNLPVVSEEVTACMVYPLVSDSAASIDTAIRMECASPVCQKLVLLASLLGYLDNFNEVLPWTHFTNTTISFWQPSRLLLDSVYACPLVINTLL